MRSNLQPVSLVVVSRGNRKNDKRYGGHRFHPGRRRFSR
jgi:hypothetical protein